MFRNKPFGENVEGLGHWAMDLYAETASIFFPRRCPNGCSLFVVFTQGGGQASARVCETVWSTIMAKFLCIYREPTVKSAKPSPEELQALQAAWYTWLQTFSTEIVPGGHGLNRPG